jgi:flagellar assembly factor FliW
MAQEDIILSFPRGLLGFPQLTAFRLFEPKDGYPIKFLQAVDQEDVSFTCIDVKAIKPDYVVPLSDEDARSLALHEPADALILALLAIPADPSKMTANLAGPLVINIQTLQARQIVLNIDHFPLQYPVLAGK